MTDAAVSDLQAEIEAAWERRESDDQSTTGPVRAAVEETLRLLDQGRLRASVRDEGGRWAPSQWVKQAILLSFRLTPSQVLRAGTQPLAPLPGRFDLGPEVGDGNLGHGSSSRRAAARNAAKSGAR